MSIEGRDILVHKTVAGDVTTGTKLTLQAPFSGKVIGCTGTVGTAGTTTSIVLDVKINGTSVYATTANKPTIAVSPNVISVEGSADGTTSFVAGDILTVTVGTADSGNTGADLDLCLWVEKS